MMIKDHQILELIVFIERLESTSPVPSETAKALKIQRDKAMFFSPASRARFSEKEYQNQLQQHIAMMKADRFDDPLHKMDFSPDATRERKQDFAANLKTSVMSFDRFIRIGETPAHGHPARIGVLLRKAKLHDLSDRFNAAWVKHFPGVRL